MAVKRAAAALVIVGAGGVVTSVGLLAGGVWALLTGSLFLAAVGVWNLTSTSSS